MPLPLSQPFGGGAVTDLGFGGQSLADQATGETEEERRKRLLRQQQMSRLSPAALTLGLGAAGTFGGR